MVKVIGGNVLRTGRLRGMLHWRPGSYKGSRRSRFGGIHDYRGSPVQVHLGSSELYSENSTIIEVKSIVVHQGYAAPSCYNDIALVKLAKSLIFNLNLRPACLPVVKTPSSAPGSIKIATGWGKQGFGQEPSMNLMKVSLRVVDNNKCNKFYKRESETPSLTKGITSSMICAIGHQAVFHDTCQGDSGGPLQSYKEGSKCMMEIVGITSFGKSCGTGIPAVYTKVEAYLDWIENVVWP